MNPLGGQNPNGLYIPLSDIEQDFLQQQIVAQNLEVVVHGWGVKSNPLITVGDKRIGVKFEWVFDIVKPTAIISLDLELRTKEGYTIYRETQPFYQELNPDGTPKPNIVFVGEVFGLAFDVSLMNIDPRIIKALMPNTIGLTSKRIDKDTGVATAHGNMKLTPLQKKLLLLAEPQNLK